MKKTRCKFVCSSVTDYGHGMKEVSLQARYDETLKEDQSFAQATPCGEMKFTVSNPAAQPMFVPNEEYYIDITLIEKPSPQPE